MSYQDDLILLVQRAIALAKTVLASQKNVAVAPVPIPAPIPAPAPAKPTQLTPQAGPPAAPDALRFDTPQQAWHSTRVLCDRMQTGLTLKNIICACIYQESGFYNRNLNGSPVKNENKNAAGVVTSRDFGICQVNDYYHIGPGKDFPSVDYVVNNPEKMVAWMIQRALGGQLRMWSSYSTGAYKRWLPLLSPMWKLAAKVQ